MVGVLRTSPPCKNVRLNEIHLRRRNGCRVTFAPKAITQALTDIGSHSLRRASEVSNVMIDYSISAGRFRWQRGVCEQAMESRFGETGTMPSVSRVHGFHGPSPILSPTLIVFLIIPNSFLHSLPSESPALFALGHLFIPFSSFF